MLVKLTRYRIVDPTCRIGLHSTRVDAVSVVRSEVLLGEPGVFEPHNGKFLSMIRDEEGAKHLYSQWPASTGSDPRSYVPVVWLGPNVAF